MEISIEFDPEAIVGKLTLLRKIQLPIAASIALNQTAFKIREEMQEEARTVFRDPVPFTINAFLYRKATPDNLQASVYIRDDAPKGNPPASYLAPHIYGGPAYRTRFQKGLSRVQDPSPLGMGASMLPPNRLMVPTQSPNGVRFTSRGHMSPGQYEQILSYIQRTDSTRTANTRGRTSRKSGFTYFYMNQAMVDERRNLVNRRPGIFMRRGGKYPIMRVMTESKIPTFTRKFLFMELGTQKATTYFPQFLLKQKFL